jgi:predicted amidophosphoribosyltransferase
VPHNLIRVRHTPQQAFLTQIERWTNIQEAFKIKSPREFAGKSVLLVDDLLTTGATVSEAARVLKEADAKTIGVLSLAITPSSLNR